MIRTLSVALLGVCIACSAGPEDDSLHTMFLQYSRPPSAQDEAAVRAAGGTEVTTILIARAITLRTASPAIKFVSLPGVVRSVDLGPDEDPVRSVFVAVVSEPTASDTSFVRAAGAELVGIIPPTTIAATMRLSAVPTLGENPRFTEVTIGLDDNTPQ